MDNWKDKFPIKNRFYETENGILYCGDSLNIISLFPSESLHLLLTDPPYKVSQTGKKISRKNIKDISLDFGKWDTQWDTNDSFYVWIEEWFKECVRVLQKDSWLYIFFDKQKIGIFDLFLAPKYNIKARTIFIWGKTNPVPQFRKKNWLSASEFCWVGSKGDSKIKNFLQQKEMFNYMLTPNKAIYGKTKHPTEKPESVWTKLIKVNSYENEIVLDPFLGSGTTAVVCEKLNRKWIGIEINEEYCEMAKQRIEDYLNEKKSKLF